MTPYQAYQLSQIERPKSPAELRRADEQLGRMAESVTKLCERVAQRVTALARPLRDYHGQPEKRMA